MAHFNTRKLREMVEACGLTLVGEPEVGKHYKFRVRAPDGRETQQTCPVTPSDQRGMQNKMAGLRRFAKNIPGRWG